MALCAPSYPPSASPRSTPHAFGSRDILSLWSANSSLAHTLGHISALYHNERDREVSLKGDRAAALGNGIIEAPKVDQDEALEAWFRAFIGSA